MNYIQSIKRYDNLNNKRGLIERVQFTTRYITYRDVAKG